MAAAATSNTKASNAEIAENSSRVLDKGNGLFCFSRRALRPLRFILLQARRSGAAVFMLTRITHHDKLLDGTPMG
jgi:hypothetical protein